MKSVIPSLVLASLSVTLFFASLSPVPSWAVAPSRASVRRICDVRDFGAVGDGRTADTVAIQKAVDDCARDSGKNGTREGGTVRLRDGVYLSGTIRLRTGVEFFIDRTAILKGTRDDRAYPDLNPPSRNSELRDCKKALLYAESVSDVAITGTGTIDGSGDNPQWTGKERTRPMAVFLALAQRVKIDSIRVRNAGMWAVVALESSNIVIRGIDVQSLATPNRDGIDIVDSHHVLIEEVSIASDDDAICLKSGSAVGVEDVTVRNSVIRQTGSNALKLGTASVGSFRKILFDGIRIERAYKAAMEVLSVDGGVAENITFRNISFQNTGSALFVLLGRRFLSPATGSVRNIRFEGIRGMTNQSWGSAISGTAGFFGVSKIQNVSLSDVRVHATVRSQRIPAEPPEYNGQYPDPNMWGDLPTKDVYLRHVEGIRMTNTVFD